MKFLSWNIDGTSAVPKKCDFMLWGTFCVDLMQKVP